MRTPYLKALWQLRFEKTNAAEKEAVKEYQEILDDCLTALGPEDPVVETLKRLVKEEREHEELSCELLDVCQRTHPEVDSELEY